jgi:metal-sulfur cluster biosynthetic enzyme
MLPSPVDPSDRSSASDSPADQGPDANPPDLIQRIWAQLRTCHDPEIPVNIVDLGLVYDVQVTGDRVDVKITLTSPGCHLGGMIAGHVQSRLLEIEGIEEANVELVWDPPWQPQMISPAGREKLGLALE